MVEEGAWRLVESLVKCGVSSLVLKALEALRCLLIRERDQRFPERVHTEESRCDGSK
jgi:hypothetical protein